MRQLCFIPARKQHNCLCVWNWWILKPAPADYADSLKLGEPQRALFKNQKGWHFSANTVCNLFLEIYKPAGLQDASTHSGRRTYITRLANKGVRVLAALAGHSSIALLQTLVASHNNKKLPTED
jgi:integrase/recombinase XerD